MSARQDTLELMRKIGTRNVFISFDDANTLRRAEIILHRWAEQECGDGSGWAIERDDTTGIPYRYRYSDRLPMHCHRYRIADKERGALKRVAEVCKRNGLHFYHQTDPRGSALYLHNQPMPENNYTIGFAV